jgi:hypothetical protein
MTYVGVQSLMTTVAHTPDAATTFTKELMKKQGIAVE